MKINRRGLLGGLIASLAAPAVIRPGLLMPVSTFALPTYGPGGMLTMAMIAAEFNRSLQSHVPRTIIPGTKGHEQSHVDFQVSRQELTLSLQEFRGRYIAPSVAVLADHINQGDGALSVGRIAMPELYVSAAIDDRNGVMARVIHDYQIGLDAYVMRLDVLHT